MANKFGLTDCFYGLVSARTIMDFITRHSGYMGKYTEKEIDFVAVKQDEKLYVQVCRTLPENSDRELANLKAIKDNYPKYVVTMDSSVCGNENGIKIVHIKDFLQNKN